MPIQLIKVVVQDGTIAKTVITTSGAFISNHDATNYKTIEGINHLEGVHRLPLKKYNQTDAYCSDDGFSFSETWVLKFAKFTFHTIFEMGYKLHQMCASWIELSSYP